MKEIEQKEEPISRESSPDKIVEAILSSFGQPLSNETRPFRGNLPKGMTDRFRDENK